MTHRDVIAVGASAGGVEALRATVGGLPADLPAAVLVVLHVPRDSPSALPAILRRAGPLPVAPAEDGEPLRPGHVFVAAPDRHLLLIGDRIRLGAGPTENGHRPAVDPLFRSVAQAAGTRGVGVVLSGNGDDGAAGTIAIASRGGAVVVQDPEDALYSSMPLAACARRTPDHVAPAAELGKALSALVSQPIEAAAGEYASAVEDQGGDWVADVPQFGCPDCGGVLVPVTGDAVPRLRCRVGHAWSPEGLLTEQALATEGALWTALRALEEKAALSRRMADSPAARVYGDRYRRLADDSDNAGAQIRRLIDRLAGRADSPGPPGEVA